MKVWLGGLFNPGGYITATRQCIAQANSWSLEELSLQIQIADSDDNLSFDECSFGVTGLFKFFFQIKLLPICASSLY